MSVVMDASWFSDPDPKSGRFRLGQDIDITANVGVTLTGVDTVFDGDERKIRIGPGIRGFEGLFKLEEGASVINVIVEVARDASTDESSSYLHHVEDHEIGGGWLVRHGSEGSVRFCHTDGDANAMCSGCLAGSHFCGSVYGCVTRGNVTAPKAGGIVGCGTGNDEHECCGTPTEVRKCAALGTRMYGSFNGGVCGGSMSFEGTIVDCYATFCVSGTDSGGIAAYVKHSTIERCYTSGAIGATKSDSCGGIVATAMTSILRECFTTGTIGEGVGCEDLGGLAHQVLNDTIVTDCYATGDLCSPLCAGLVVHPFTGSSVTCCYWSGKRLADATFGLSCLSAGDMAGIAVRGVYVTDGVLYDNDDYAGNGVPYDRSVDVEAIVGRLPPSWDGTKWCADSSGLPMLRAFQDAGTWAGYRSAESRPAFAVDDVVQMGQCAAASPNGTTYIYEGEQYTMLKGSSSRGATTSLSVIESDDKIVAVALQQVTRARFVRGKQVVASFKALAFDERGCALASIEPGVQFRIVVPGETAERLLVYDAGSQTQMHTALRVGAGTYEWCQSSFTLSSGIKGSGGGTATFVLTRDVGSPLYAMARYVTPSVLTVRLMLASGEVVAALDVQPLCGGSHSLSEMIAGRKITGGHL